MQSNIYIYIALYPVKIYEFAALYIINNIQSTSKATFSPQTCSPYLECWHPQQKNAENIQSNTFTSNLFSTVDTHKDGSDTIHKNTHLKPVLSCGNINTSDVRYAEELSVGVVLKEGQHRDDALRMDHDL